MDLKQIGTLTLEMAAPARFDGGPAGTRIIVEFTSVRLEGEGIDASRRGATAGDWLVVGPDGTASLDARFLLETSDGAMIYVAGPGRTNAAGFATGDAAVVFAFTFETGDHRYAWLNQTVALARGFAEGSKVSLEVVGC